MTAPVPPNGLITHRAELFVALEQAAAAYATDYTGRPFRVHEHIPPMVSAPCAWIGIPNLSWQQPLWIVTSNLLVAVDGGRAEQQSQLEVLIGYVLDQLNAVPRIQINSCAPRELDVTGSAGPTHLLAYAISTQKPIQAASLCPPRINDEGAAA